MTKLKSKEEIELMRQSAQLVSKTLGMLATEIRPGVTTRYLDNLAETFIKDHKAVPGFLGLYDFPNTLCMSVNEQVVHGIPTNKPLVDGDIISIDCGVLRNGFYGDHAYTFAIGEITPEVQQLLDVTKKVFTWVSSKWLLEIESVISVLLFRNTLKNMDMGWFVN